MLQTDCCHHLGSAKEASQHPAAPTKSHFPANGIWPSRAEQLHTRLFFFLVISCHVLRTDPSSPPHKRAIGFHRAMAGDTALLPNQAAPPGFSGLHPWVGRSLGCRAGGTHVLWVLREVLGFCAEECDSSWDAWSRHRWSAPGPGGAHQVPVAGAPCSPLTPSHNEPLAPSPHPPPLQPRGNQKEGTGTELCQRFAQFRGTEEGKGRFMGLGHRPGGSRAPQG